VRPFSVIGSFFVAGGTRAYAAVVVVALTGLAVAAICAAAVLLAPALLAGRARRQRYAALAARSGEPADEVTSFLAPVPPSSRLALGPAAADGPVMLPPPAVPAVLRLAPAQRTLPTARPPSAAGARRVLLAGGDDVWRQIVGSALQGRAYAVAGIAGCRHAATSLRRTPAEVVVLRIEMTSHDLRAAAAIRRSFPHTPLLAICDAAAILEAARLLGARNVLVEPVPPQMLCDEVESQFRDTARRAAARLSAAALGRAAE
jgi:AmiR/NasT family two-component response regulator